MDREAISSSQPERPRSPRTRASQCPSSPPSPPPAPQPPCPVRQRPATPPAAPPAAQAAPEGIRANCSGDFSNRLRPAARCPSRSGTCPRHSGSCRPRPAACLRRSGNRKNRPGNPLAHRANPFSAVCKQLTLKTLITLWPNKTGFQRKSPTAALYSRSSPANPHSLGYSCSFYFSLDAGYTPKEMRSRPSSRF